jgi:hypothetical protein
MTDPDKDRPFYWYCADCKSKFDRHRQFEHRDHIAARVRGPTGEWWLRRRKCLRDWERHCSPSALLRKCSWLKKDSDTWVVGRGAILVVFLLFVEVNCQPLTVVLFILSALLIFDIVVTNVAIAFVTRAPADPLRSVSLALLSFFELALGFAVFFAALEPKGCVGHAWKALHFSWLVITTVTGKSDGFEGHWIDVIVSLEVMTSVVFLVAVLQTMVSWNKASDE